MALSYSGDSTPGVRLIYEPELNLSFFSKTVPSEKFYDIGLLYRRVTKTKIIRLSISGGIGVLAGTERGSFLYNGESMGSIVYYKEEHIFAPAIPLEVDLSFIPAEYFGIGISGFTNLNFEKNMVGFIIKLELGKIR